MSRSIFFISLLLICKAVTSQPANDLFADRTLIPSIPATVDGDNTDATTEAGDPATYRSIWWKFTPLQTGSYYFTINPVYSPYLVFGVYTGSLLVDLEPLSGISQSGMPPYTVKRKYELTAGIEYSILVGSSRSWDTQDLSITISQNRAPEVSLTNPDGNVVYYAGKELELQVDVNDPDGSIARVDYYFGPHVQGTPDISSTTYPFSSIITLPNASYYEQVTAVVTDNEGASSVSEKVTFLVTFFTENDFFDDRKQLSGDIVLDIGNNRYATNEPNEPAGSKSIWWSWTAPENKVYAITARGWPAGFYPKLDVYTGSSVASLTSIASNQFSGSDTTYCAQVMINAISGQTYAIRTTTVGGIGGDNNLSIVPKSDEGTPLELLDFQVNQDDELEFLFMSNDTSLSELQSSNDLNGAWTSSFGKFLSNGLYKVTRPRPEDNIYFYRFSETN